MPKLSQREILTEGILSTIGKAIGGGFNTLKKTGQLAKSAVKTLDPNFYSTVTKPFDLGLSKRETPSLRQAFKEWLPGAEGRKFNEFLISKGYYPVEKIRGDFKSGSIRVAEVDFNEKGEPKPLMDGKKVVVFRYPLHFRQDDNGEYIMTKSPSATGRRTYYSSDKTATSNDTTSWKKFARKYIRYAKANGYRTYDPIPSYLVGRFLVREIGLTNNPARNVIEKATKTSYLRDRDITAKQIKAIAQILIQRGII